MAMDSEYYFRQLTDVLNSEDLWAERYTELHRILIEMMNEVTERTGLVFSGPFARLTYLAREYGIDHDLYARVNNFRSLCRNIGTTDTKLLADHFIYDVRDVSSFVSNVLGVQVPEALAERLPKTIKRWSRQHTQLKYLRVSVESFDDNYIYAITENFDEENIKLCYTDAGNYFGNWSYVKGLLKKGTQLNIIHPKKKGEEYVAELIIFEPDYLLDISSIAACFENYGATPFNYLLNKIKPSPNGKAILLGNFASQLLDEVINTPEQNDISVSYRTFLQNDAIGLATCNDNLSSFTKDAADQRDNIRNIIAQTQRSDKDFELDKIVLEPSFFCEMLGFQGRMDLLHIDYKVLLEQKSGKREYGTNRHIEKHYVQMLLYLALLHYSFDLRNEDISCYLLYSKYADGLIQEGAAPKLLFDALKLRNQIVWLEYFLVSDGGRILSQINVDRINVNGLRDKFFLQYQYDKIREPLVTIQNATLLEKEYFFRMFSFIQRENILGKVGASQKEASGLAALWNCTVEEKKLAGSIFEGLRIDSAGLDALEMSGEVKRVGIKRLTLIRNIELEDDYVPNFRKGDRIILYKYLSGETPDARKGVVLRGNIRDITIDSITIDLRAAQKNIGLFHQQQDTLWAMEQDFMDSSCGAQYRGLYALLCANSGRRNLILAQRQPERDTSVSLNGDYGMFNELVLKAKQAKDYFIVIGPPGTGKTSFGLLNILKETLTDNNSNILLMSYTNRAVDEICSKLVKEGLGFIRVGNEVTCADEYKDYLLDNKALRCSDANEVRQMLVDTRIMVGTTSSLTSKQELFHIKQFDIAIIDEASQILEPQLLPLLCAKHENDDAIRKFVMIGDHKQLPAVVQQSVEESKVDNELLNSIHLYNCRNSLFERLLSFHDADDSPYVFRLTRQGRMHHDVALFSSESFYGNKLQVVPLVHQEAPISFPDHDIEGMEQLLATHRTAFIPVPRPQHSPSCKVNLAEAKVIASIVYAGWNLYKKNGRVFKTDDTIGVIVPYRNQIAAVRKEIDKYNVSELHDITIDTVERYQGSERDIIIYGFTIQREYQLNFLTSNVFEEDGQLIDRKLNVALTRAREHNIVIGNPELLSFNSIFRKLIRCI